MHLVYIANNRFPSEKANGLQIAKMSEAFIEAGVDFLFISPKRKQTENIPDPDPQTFYKLRQKIPIKQLWCLDLLEHHWLPGPSAFFLQTISFFINLRLQRRRLFKPLTIVYSRSIGVLPFLPRKISYFFEAHTFPKTRLGQIYQKWILKKSAGIICISEGIAQKYRRLTPSANLLIAHDAVDLELFKNLSDQKTARQKLNLPLDKPLVLYTGSPFSWKGVFTLAKATAPLKNISTVFLGGRAKEPDFLKLRAAAPHALTIPFVSHDKVPLYLAAADLLILPNSALDPISREDTSPLKLFEYLASDRPILASRVPALLNILTKKEAYFFEPDNPLDLRQQITAILSNPEKSTIRTYSAHQKAKQNTWGKRARNIINFMLKSKS